MGNQLTNVASQLFPSKAGSKSELSSTESGHGSKCDQPRGTTENGVDSERYIVQYSMCSYSICRLFGVMFTSIYPARCISCLVY